MRPEIFGTLFEHSTDKAERHAFGAHFTSPVDIMKIVGPTIVEPWREQIEGAKTVKRLQELRQRMHHFTVLDPACGSGNFLYIAYRELKRLEVRIHERICEMSAKADPAQRVFGFVTASNFFGMDIIPFAVELAKVTMMIARKLAIDELHITEQALPLDNLDANFLACDALIDAAGNPDAVAEGRRDHRQPAVSGGEAAQAGARARLRQRHSPGVPRRARHGRLLRLLVPQGPRPLAALHGRRPVAGRAGLVGTQNVRNNQSRVGGLDHVVKTGTIIEAVDNQPWSGEANVHVSIVDLGQDAGREAVARQTAGSGSRSIRRAGVKKPRKRGSGPASKEYELDIALCDHIKPGALRQD